MECIFHRTCFKGRTLPGSTEFFVWASVFAKRMFRYFFDRSVLAKCF